VLDLDSLARTEKANWVWQGTTCAEPAEQRCLLFLSDGGEDANTVREFDLGSRSFVENGFSLPKGKQRVAWTSADTILVAREWQSGELTAGEATRLEGKETALNQETRDMRELNGGKLTPKDKAVVNQQQDRLSKQIYNQKHDAQTQPQ